MKTHLRWNGCNPALRTRASGKSETKTPNLASITSTHTEVKLSSKWAVSRPRLSLFFSISLSLASLPQARCFSAAQRKGSGSRRDDWEQKSILSGVCELLFMTKAWLIFLFEAKHWNENSHGRQLLKRYQHRCKCRQRIEKEKKHKEQIVLFFLLKSFKY